jgi:hypothetical protein
MNANKLPHEKVLETTGVLALACLVVALLAHRPGVRGGFLAAAAALLAAGLFVKPAGRLVAAVWLRFAEVLGAVNSRIILGVVFYVFLTPIALLARLTRGDLLGLKRRGGAGRSYWLERRHAYTKADLEKIW